MLDETALISFITDVQLKLRKPEGASDQILTLLCLYAEKKIDRDLCLLLVNMHLSSNVGLQERFCEITNSLPLPNTRSGSIIDDTFINTVVEFELWPGALTVFLGYVRQAINGSITILDAFIYLESIKQTSGPFWLLWDLFKKRSNNEVILQLIYDGCVDSQLLPRHIEIDLPPKNVREYHTLLSPNQIIDSDLLCIFKVDCHPANRPIGILRKGSYGLLDRDVVDCSSSGRTIDDFSVINDRWATSASGSEDSFSVSRKTQFEEKMFYNEDERTDFDVRLSRLQHTIRHLNNRKPMTDLDYYSLSELYTKPNMNGIVENIINDPDITIPIVIKRLENRVNQMIEWRHNKESDYYALSKKNHKKTNDNRHDQSSPLTPHALSAFEGGNSHNLSFELSTAKIAIDIIQETALLQGIKGDVCGYISSLLDLYDDSQAGEIPNIESFTYPSLTNVSEGFVYYCIPDMYRILSAFESIAQSIQQLLSIKSSKTDDSSPELGFQVTLALGHFSISSNGEKTNSDSLTSILPAYLASQKQSPALEYLIETAPLVFDSLKLSLTTYIKYAVKLQSNPNTDIIINSQKSKNPEYIRFTSLNALAGQFFFVIEKQIADQAVSLKVLPHPPKMLRTRKTAYIQVDDDKTVSYIDDSNLEAEQMKILLKRRHKHRLFCRSSSLRQINNSIYFRLGPGGIEFTGTNADLIGKEIQEM